MLNAIAKLYYTITEVSKIIGEEQHVLRYWEREFPQLKPQKNRAGNRVYTTKDLTILRVIQRLLRTERYTVSGAKEYLMANDVHSEIANGFSDVAKDEEPGSNVEQPSAQQVLHAANVAEVAQVVRELKSISEELRNASTKLND
jgi:DNA-binding transcriptional MerR regulator